MVTSYEFYKNTFFGDVISEADFPKWATKAEDDLNYIANGNITDDALVTYCMQVQKAVCALADVEYQLSEASKAPDAENPGAIRSISSGGESISFDAHTSVITAVLGDKAAQDRLKFDTVRPYLFNTGLLFQGL